MINIKTLASSSAGNAHMIDDGETRLLLDCGLQFKLLRQKFNFQLSGISAVLITHEHADHSRAAKELMKSGLECYMAKETAEALGLSGHRLHTFEPLDVFQVGTWYIKNFPLEHDCPNFGYLLENRQGERLAYITDSFYCRFRPKGLTHLVIECNYALDILNQNVADGIIEPELKNRIIKSHMSLTTVKEFLAANDLSKLRQIVLIHLSSDNSDAARFKREIQEITGVPVYIGGE